MLAVALRKKSTDPLTLFLLRLEADQRLTLDLVGYAVAANSSFIDSNGCSAAWFLSSSSLMLSNLETSDAECLHDDAATVHHF